MLRRCCGIGEMNQQRSYHNVDTLLRQLSSEYRQQPRVKHDIIGKTSIPTSSPTSSSSPSSSLSPSSSSCILSLVHACVGAPDCCSATDTYTSSPSRLGLRNNDGTEHKLPLLTGLCFSSSSVIFLSSLSPLLLLLLLLPLLHLLLLILRFVSFTLLHFTSPYLTSLYFTSLHSIRTIHCYHYSTQHPTGNLCSEWIPSTTTTSICTANLIYDGK